MGKTFRFSRKNKGKSKTARGRKQDRYNPKKSHRWRSKEPWERGRGAPRKGNPRYKPVIRKGRKVYILRNKPKPKGKPKMHVQKALGKKPGQAKFLTGRGKTQTKPARGPKRVVKPTKARKLDTGRSKWF